MSETNSYGVLAAIAAVTKAMAASGISKDRRNKEQGYDFRGIDDVLNSLAALYAQNGIVVIPKFSERTVTERQTKSGGALFSVVVVGIFNIYHSDGSSIVSGPFYGEAMDTADKATNKAMSAAYKYFAIQTFAIPTKGDNDADATTHEVAANAATAAKPITGQQVTQDAFDELPPDAQQVVREWAMEVIGIMEDGKMPLAQRVDEAAKFVLEKTNDGSDQEGLLALSSQLGSKIRNPIKERMREIHRERKAAKAEPAYASQP